MKYLLLCLGLLMLSYATGQDTQLSEEEAAVKAVTLEVFDAMRASDSVRLKQCFYDDVTVFTSYTNRSGKAVLKSDEIQGFYTSVGTPHDGLYDERLGDYQIKVDDNLASMWVDFYFFVDDNFSHCGVNYFQFFKTEDGWKIFFLSDTRKKKSCDVPDKAKLW
ncbi:nuclear transport factor 2 family protein [Saprospiraceae bacterium]|nr:nuclear transport factor 2 family protein [Saprospiraceae bacterium]